jgi:hypothetical protein
MVGLLYYVCGQMGRNQAIQVRRKRERREISRTDLNPVSGMSEHNARGGLLYSVFQT